MDKVEKSIHVINGTEVDGRDSIASTPGSVGDVVKTDENDKIKIAAGIPIRGNISIEMARKARGILATMGCPTKKILELYPLEPVHVPPKVKPPTKGELARIAREKKRQAKSAEEVLWEEVITTETVSLYTPDADQGRRAYKCKVCSKVFEKKTVITAHIDFIHKGIKKHKCSFCDKAYGTKSHLRTHERTHTGMLML